MGYILPFKKRPVFVGQGFNGTSHKYWPEDKEDFSYSVDFLLPEGTKIIASRTGIVTKVKQSGKRNYKGQDLKKGNEFYKNQMNEIVIEHSDGTYASYSHLKYKGCFVKVGEKVRKGQIIGLSGNTGWSSAPHLDFTVFKKKVGEYRIKSLKIKFVDYNHSLEDKDNKVCSRKTFYHGSPKLLKVLSPQNAIGITDFENQKTIFLCKTFGHAALYAISKHLKGKAVFAVKPDKLIIVGEKKLRSGYVYEVKVKAEKGPRNQYSYKKRITDFKIKKVNPKDYKDKIFYVNNEEGLWRMLK